MSNGPSHQQEQAERKAIISAEAKQRNLNTLQAFAQAEANSIAGRFKVTETATITGTRPRVDVPNLLTSNPQNQMALVPPEPTIDGRDCGTEFGVALFPHENEGDDDCTSSFAGDGVDQQPEAGVGAPSTNSAQGNLPPHALDATEGPRGNHNPHPPFYSQDATPTFGLGGGVADGAPDVPPTASVKRQGEAVGERSQSSRPTIRRRMI